MTNFMPINGQIPWNKLPNFPIQTTQIALYVLNKLNLYFKNLSPKNTPGTDGFIDEFCQTVEEETIPIPRVLWNFDDMRNFKSNTPENYQYPSWIQKQDSLKNTSRANPAIGQKKSGVHP